MHFNLLWGKIKVYRSGIALPDYLNQLFIYTLSAIILLNLGSFTYGLLWILINTIISAVIIYIIKRYENFDEQRKKKESPTRIIRYWYPVFMILFLFKEIYLIMVNLELVLYDSYLINIDRAIFGVNPTQYLYKFANPYLTEFLQIIYAAFYLMPLIFGLELYLWRRLHEIRFSTFTILLGFFLSFIGYLIVPAIGPRFTLHSFATINTELPGLYITNFLRDVINFGESIPKGILNPELVAQRDGFPSGHTIIILLIAYLSRLYRSKSFYFYMPYAILMIFSTVYLRYHYVIDLIAGFVVAAVTVLISRRVYKDRIISTDYGLLRKGAD